MSERESIELLTLFIYILPWRRHLNS